MSNSISPSVGRLAPSTFGGGNGGCSDRSGVIRPLLTIKATKRDFKPNPVRLSENYNHNADQQDEHQATQQNHKQAASALKFLKNGVEQHLAVLVGRKADWQKRVKALEHIQELLGQFPEDTSSLSKQTVLSTLYPLQDVLCDQVTELR